MARLPMSYKTKTQKKNACNAITRKSFKLYSANLISMKDLDVILKIMERAERKI